MRKKDLAKAANDLGVPKETLTKENAPLLDGWLRIQEAKPKPARKKAS